MHVALLNVSYDDKIVHIVPIIYMLMHFYDIDNMLFSLPVGFNAHQFKLNHVFSSF